MSSNVLAERAGRVAATSAGYDVVIVGGGVNGLGIAWDAALRGLRVLVLEKGDVGSGTSSWSSKMIHGGLKYLEKYDVPLVRESLREREWLVKAAPHLVKELRFIIPFYRDNAHHPATLAVGMVAYDVLSFDKSLQRFRLFTRDQLLRREPGLNPDGLTGGAIYSDAQVNYAERMSWEIALAALRAGAEVLTHCRVTTLQRGPGGAVTGVTFTDELDGTDHTVPAQAVINAAGPWIDKVWTGNPGLGLSRMNGGTKGTHLVVDRFPGAPQDAFYYESEDARPMMVIPWMGRYLIGSTDIRSDDDLDTITASQDEYDYILHETNKVLPRAHLGMNDIRYSFTGVRPLPYADANDVADITRRHDIRQHDGIDGLYTLVGGKLTTFRQVGQDVGDLLMKRFGLKRKSVTRRLPLPGGGQPNKARLRAEIPSNHLPAHTVDRLVAQYGTMAPDVVAFILQAPERQEVLDQAFGLTAGEVEWAITREHAYRLADVMSRRIMVGLENDLGTGCLEAVAAVCQRALGWTDQQTTDEIQNYRTYIQRFIPRKESVA